MTRGYLQYNEGREQDLVQKVHFATPESARNYGTLDR